MKYNVCIEVFRTNVTSERHANMLLHQIHTTYADYEANFDLDDCDKILRVKCNGRSVDPAQLIDMLKDYGFDADVLPDDAQLTDNALSNELQDIFRNNSDWEK
jgi:hypothetical protein